MECSNPAFNKHTKQLGQNQDALIGLNVVPLVFLSNAYLLSTSLEHSRSDFVFEQFRLCNNFIFGMLYHETKGEPEMA